MTFDIERAAALLIEARSQARQVTPFSPAPSTSDEAYAVQDVVASRIGAIGAWKVGAKAAGQTPNAAPVPSRLVRPGPTDWPSSSLHMIGVEAELAFRLGRDIPARSEPVSRDEIWASIESVHAAIEVVDTRLADWRNADRLWVLADNQSNGGFVYDPKGASLSAASFADAAVRLVVNGRAIVDRRGGNPAGDPRWLVEWLVDHCARRRGGMRAGMFVTTGSYTGMEFVEPGASVQAVFDGIGAVDLRFP
ncbi:2-keto-4-pentenoate hydratase [Bosea sp. LC85]|uniref:2-keto-4-pentenoate hydratase n=1 Tax=Bosea sp. LC85 TaxID=1502851 RepID=UPI0004E41066|nr:fumarylacetoacetate hydrolase family protein [Bosea sp. LC85]KFC73086.1 2-keto-4-pentenoate hydratase [Bosea sp. LC85]